MITGHLIMRMRVLTEIVIVMSVTVEERGILISNRPVHLSTFSA